MITRQRHPAVQSCSTVVELLRHRAAQDPDRTALTFLADADTVRATLTYAELDHKARAIAGMLQARRLTAERALLVYPPGLDYVVALFGCLYAGVVAVPTYPPRRNRSTQRLQAIVDNARAAVVIVLLRLLCTLRAAWFAARRGSPLLTAEPTSH